MVENGGLLEENLIYLHCFFQVVPWVLFPTHQTGFQHLLCCRYWWWCCLFAIGTALATAPSADVTNFATLWWQLSTAVSLPCDGQQGSLDCSDHQVTSFWLDMSCARKSSNRPYHTSLWVLLFLLLLWWDGEMPVM